MKYVKRLLIILAVSVAVCAIYWAISDERTVVLHPKGLLARRELSLIRTNLGLMMLIMVPTWLWLFWTAWKYRASNSKAEFDPHYKPGKWNQSLQWGIPSALIAVMAVVNWPLIRELDPYRPIDSDVKPLEIQVI